MNGSPRSDEEHQERVQRLLDIHEKIKIYCDSPRYTSIDLLNKYTFYIFYSRHTEIQYVCTILIKRAKRDKFRMSMYLVVRIIHFRHKSWYQNFCLLKVRSSLDFYFAKTKNTS